MSLLFYEIWYSQNSSFLIGLFMLYFNKGMSKNGLRLV